MSQSGAAAKKDVLDSLKNMLNQSAENLVPWFYENMPDYYFKTHDKDEQLTHLHAILSGQVKTEKQSVVMKSPCGTRVTHITPGGDMKRLVEVVNNYADQSINSARIYSSNDQELRLDTFILGERACCDGKGCSYENALERILDSGLLPEGKKDEFSAFLATTTSDYVEKFESNRVVRHFNTCCSIRDTEDVFVKLENDVHPGIDRVAVAMDNPPRKGLFLQAVKLFARENINILRAYGDEFEKDDNGRMVVMSFYIDQSDVHLQPDTEQWERIRRQLKMIKWFAFHGLEQMAEEEGWEISKVKLMQAACEFCHQFFVRDNIYAYTSDRIVNSVLRNRNLANKLVVYFETRFDPQITKNRDRELKKSEDDIRSELSNIPDDVVRNIMQCILRFFRNTLRTNYFMPNRLGLSFRMDPDILDFMPKEERPFGFYCFHGPYCFSFQVRYRDMARGGVRIVPTKTQEQFEIESNRLFDEVTKLAKAQQFKNKDIPEGGSKAVILLGPDGDRDLALKSMVDSFLDLLITDEKGRLPSNIVDYLDHEEIIYLGPDENVTSAHINWIVSRAAERGYKWPSAFMSSKPGAGISHKEFGVTSEGVIVFADVVLNSLGIDPRKQPFTVKMTGGPAGDVASNAVKIMFREYGDNPRILCMSDGHGAVYDPDGLDHDELMRLIDGALKCSHFDPGKLKGKKAFVVSTEDQDGVKIRDDIHNWVEADIFIPSGGRPDTINMKNWQKFLKEDGSPTARAMVEGANIFISSEARAKLEKAGMVAVPGHSANKTGVICSSYEILAGLCLSTEEFLDIKKDYVEQVLNILRARARSEAELLVREYRLASGKKSITDLSYDVSLSINSLADAIYGVLNGQSDQLKNEELRSLILEYCPSVLAERYADRLTASVPVPHQVALLAAYISSKIYYQEGLGWVDSLVDISGINDVIHAYLEQERKVGRFKAEMLESSIKDKDEIIDILEKRGRKHMTMQKLGLG